MSSNGSITASASWGAAGECFQEPLKREAAALWCGSDIRSLGNPPPAVRTYTSMPSVDAPSDWLTGRCDTVISWVGVLQPCIAHIYRGLLKVLLMGVYYDSRQRAYVYVLAIAALPAKVSNHRHDEEQLQAPHRGASQSSLLRLQCRTVHSRCRSACCNSLAFYLQGGVLILYWMSDGMWCTGALLRICTCGLVTLSVEALKSSAQPFT